MLLVSVIPSVSGTHLHKVEQDNDDDLILSVKPKAREEGLSLSFVLSA